MSEQDHGAVELTASVIFVALIAICSLVLIALLVVLW